MKNKRILLIIVMLVLLALPLVNAAVGRNIGNWIDNTFNYAGRNWFNSNINTGLANIPFYDRNAQFIDFAIFLILFTSITMIGLKKGFAGGKETETQNAVKALAMIIGLAMTLAALKAGLSVTFFIPFVANTLFFIMIIIVFFLLLRMGMDKHKIMAFILAIVITYLLFNFAGAAVNKGRFGVDLNLGSFSVGGFDMGWFGDTCDEVQNKLQKADIELTSVKKQVNDNLGGWDITLDEGEEISPIRLFERYTELEGELTEDVKSRKQLELEDIIKRINDTEKRLKELETTLQQLGTSQQTTTPPIATQTRLERQILALENELNELKRKEVRLDNEVKREDIENTRKSINTYRDRWEKLDKNIVGLDKKKAACIEKDNWEEEVKAKEVEVVGIGDEQCKEYDEKKDGEWGCTEEIAGKECVSGLCVGKYASSRCCKIAEKVVEVEEEEEVKIVNYEILDVEEITPIKDIYSGTVKYNYIPENKIYSYGAIFEEDGSLVNSDDFAKTYLKLDSASPEFKALKEKIESIAKSKIDALKAEEEKEEEPKEKEEEKEKGLSTTTKVGGIILAIASLAAIGLYMRNRRKKPAQLKQVKELVKNRNNLIKGIRELLERKKKTIDEMANELKPEEMKEVKEEEEESIEQKINRWRDKREISSKDLGDILG